MRCSTNIARPASRLVVSSRWTIAAGAVLLIIVLASLSFLLGTKLHTQLKHTAWQLGLPQSNRVQAVLAAPKNYLQSIFSSEKSEKLIIDIKFKHIEKIRASRDKALAVGVLNTTGEDFVPATIRHGDRSIDVKLRLKGDNTDHLQDEKWSYLVEVKGGDELFGMRRFSLMNPRVRADQHDPMAYALLHELDLLSPRFLFVDLSINGRRVGVMFLEEYPAKELLESQGRRESVVLRFDEFQAWKDYELNQYWDENFENYATTVTKVAQNSKVQESPKLSADLGIATGLLKSFMRGTLPAAQVFDVEELGRYLAALELLKAENGVWWANLRFYYNPITARLEPIGSDLMSESNLSGTNSLVVMDEPVTRAMIADPDIRASYLRELHNLATQVQNGTLEEFLRPLDDKLSTILHRDLPFLPSFDFINLKRRAEFLLKTKVDNLEYIKLLKKRKHVFLMHAEEIKTGNQGSLELTNILSAPLEVSSISWKKDSGEYVDSFQPLSPLEFPLEIPATEIDAKPEVVKIPFIYPTAPADNARIEIISNIKGSDELHSATAIESYDSLDHRPIRNASIKELLARHPFIHQVEKSVLSFKPGRHEVLESVSTPEGYDLLIPAGTTLLFAHDAALIVRGALNVSGTADKPVVLDALKTLADSDEFGWPGLVVLQAENQTNWNHVNILHTTGVGHNAWNLTGGVTFYESPVTLENVLFDSNHAEDALNIVRSEFKLSNVSIQNTVSDGFDSDFSNGSVVGGRFENIGTAGGGDGIDISGSVVSVTGTQFTQISDKALSVGEASQMIAKDVQIDGAMTAAASKDASRLEISLSTIKNAQVAGMMVYVKKPEYGPASIDATNIEFIDTATHALAQIGSQIDIDGITVPRTTLDVDELYNSFMKKASP